MVNILRTIKVKEILGELDNLSEKETFFFSLFNNLVEIHSTSEPLKIILKQNHYDNMWYFDYDVANHRIYYNSDTVGLKFYRKYGISRNVITEFIQDTFQKYSIIKLRESNNRVHVINNH